MFNSTKDESNGVGILDDIPKPFFKNKEAESDEEEPMPKKKEKKKKKKKSKKVTIFIEEDTEDEFADSKPTMKTKKSISKTKKDEEPRDPDASATYESLNKLKLPKIDEKLGELGLSKAGNKGEKIERLLEGRLKRGNIGFSRIGLQ